MSHRTFQIIQKCCIAQAQSQFYLNLRENAAASPLGILSRTENVNLVFISLRAYILQALCELLIQRFTTLINVTKKRRH